MNLSTIPSQTLAELIVHGIHGEPVEVAGLMLGTPPGGWCCQVARDGRVYLATWDGEQYQEVPKAFVPTDEADSYPKAQPL